MACRLRRPKCSTSSGPSLGQSGELEPGHSVQLRRLMGRAVPCCYDTGAGDQPRPGWGVHFQVVILPRRRVPE